MANKLTDRDFYQLSSTSSLDTSFLLHVVDPVGTTASPSGFSYKATLDQVNASVFPFTGNASITGSLQVNGESQVNGNFNVSGRRLNINESDVSIESLNIGSVTSIDLTGVTNQTLLIRLDNPKNYPIGSCWSFLFNQPASTGNTVQFASLVSGIIFGSIIGLTNSQRIAEASSVTAPIGSNQVMESKVELIAIETVWHCRVTTVDASLWTIA